MSEEPAIGPARRRRRGPVLVLVSILVIAVSSWVAWPRMRRWTAERRASSAFNALSACLAVDVDSNDAELRQRTIVAELSGSAWPGDCTKHITSLSVAARAAGLAHDRCGATCCVEDGRCVAFEQLEVTADLLKTHIPEHRFVDEETKRLVDAAAVLGWEMPPANDAPPATRHLLAAAVPPLTHHGLARAALCRMSEAQWWLMMHHGNRGATLCELGLPEPTARCQGVAASIPTGDDLYLVDGGLAPMPRLFAGREGDWAVYAPAGKRVAQLPAGTLVATALPTGDAAALVPAQEGYALMVDGVSRFTLAASAPPLLYGGYVIAQSGRDLSAYAIDSGERVALGTLTSPARTTMRGCVASAVTAVRVRDDERNGDVLLTKRGGTWSIWPLPVGVPPFTLSCHGDSAHLTWIETLDTETSNDGAVRGMYRAHDVVCSPGGCRERRGDLSLRRHALRSRFFIASLGEDLAVIWRTPLGDIRARIGPPAELTRRAAVPVVEDAEHLGFAWDEAAMRLLSAERSAVFLIEQDGVHGIVLDGNGARALNPP